MEEEKEINLTERVLSAIQNRKASELREIFETVPNIDIAESIDEVDDAAVFLYIFRTVSSEYTGDFFTELTSEQQEMIINAFTDKQLIELLENSFVDDIVDIVEEMPANVVNRVLKACPPDLRKDVNSLLNYKDNTAGSVMTTEYLDMKDDLTVKDALKIIRKKGKDAETVYTIFVRDNKRNLEGTINLDDLIFADEDEKLEDIMDRDFVTCNVNDDQEDDANMFKRYDLNAMAVTNKEGKIIGIIAAVLVLGIGGYFALSGGGDSKDNTDAVKQGIEEKMASEKRVEGMAFAGGTEREGDYTGPIDDSGKPHGVGKLQMKNGTVYEGPFEHGIMQGKGAKYLYKNGARFEGEMSNNVFFKGTYRADDGSRFEGSFDAKGQPQHGTWYDEQGKLVENI